MLPTIAREDDTVVMIDQRKLPAKEIYVRCKTAAEVARAIKTMVIRGAPAIGVAAAMGIALGTRRSKTTGTQKLAAEFFEVCELMASTRPTAVNLFWAIDRMKRSFAAAVEAGESVEQIKDRLDREANAIHDEDVASCRAMGAFGAAVVPHGARILTHCNAGALATAGYGTAARRGSSRRRSRQAGTVVADERRAVSAGRASHRMELVRDGIDTTVITQHGRGADEHGQRYRGGWADRIAANGDTANKIAPIPSPSWPVTQHPVLCRGPTVDHRPECSGRPGDRSKSGIRASQPSWGQSAHAERRPHSQSCIRRDAAPPSLRASSPSVESAARPPVAEKVFLKC